MCQSFYFNKAAGLRPEACNVIKKVTLAQAFSCKFLTEQFQWLFLFITTKKQDNVENAKSFTLRIYK